MKIAMTGATGRVGTRLLPRLLDTYGDVRALVRSESSARQVSGLGGLPVHGELADPEALAILLDGADALVNAAAALRTEVPAEHERVNVAGTRTLAAAAARAGVGRVVHLSTNLVYPGRLGRPANEGDPPAPEPEWGEYPRTKAKGEDELSGAGLDLVILRLAFVYGEGDPHLRESLRWAAGWPSYRRLQLVHHADVAQAVTRGIDAPSPADSGGRTGSRIYNVADLAPISAVELHQLTDVAPPDVWSTADSDLWHGIVSTDRIRAELGFQPVYPSAWIARDKGAL